MTASEIAGTEAVSIFYDEDLARAAELLAEHHVSHLSLSVSARREPVGIVSALDLAEAAFGFMRPPRDRRIGAACWPLPSRLSPSGRSPGGRRPTT